MPKFKYKVTVYTLCEGFDVNMKFIRRWRKYGSYKSVTKAKALYTLRFFTNSGSFKATLRKEG